MKLDEFSTLVQSHGDLEGLGILFGAEESEDRLVLKRRSDGRVLTIGVRTIVESDRAEIEHRLASSDSVAPPFASPESLANAVAWSRSHIGLLKDRLVRSYSVETLFAR